MGYVVKRALYPDGFSFPFRGLELVILFPFAALGAVTKNKQWSHAHPTKATPR